MAKASISTTASPSGIGVSALSTWKAALNRCEAATGAITSSITAKSINYLELRTGLEARGCVFHTHSDTEVLLEQFALDGVDALQVCNGMFACAIWDEVEKRLFLARDRIGVKPLYYSVQRVKSFLARNSRRSWLTRGIERRLEPLSVSKYFTYGYIPAPHTIFSGIRKLEPGSYLFFD